MSVEKLLFISNDLAMEIFPSTFKCSGCLKAHYFTWNLGNTSPPMNITSRFLKTQFLKFPAGFRNVPNLMKMILNYPGALNEKMLTNNT